MARLVSGDAELHRGDEPRRVADDRENEPRPALPSLRRLLHSCPPGGDEPVLGRHEVRVQEDQRRDGDEEKRDSHAPSRGARGRGKSSATSVATV